MNLKNISCLAAALLCAALFTACPNADGLHNQKELLVTFEFSGFRDISGNYAIPGEFGGSVSWDNTNVDVVMNNGKGISNPIAVTTANIEFSLCLTNTWNRPWHKENECEGNSIDRGTAGNPYQNFYIDKLDLDAGTAVVVVEMKDDAAKGYKVAIPTSTAVTE